MAHWRQHSLLNEAAQKRLKRKEYHTSQEFANDVELVFSNALEFNQDHTEIWEDAIVLRVRPLRLPFTSNP